MTTVLEENVVHANWRVSDKVVAFTTTRAAGVSQTPFDTFNLAHHVGDDPVAVKENRRILAAHVNAGVDFQWLDQVHGIQVHQIDRAGDHLQADAMFTQRAGIALSVLTADCLPVFLAAKDGSEVGIAHAGWRGLAAGVIEQTVTAMTTNPRDMSAYLGPAIGPCHFEVGKEVVEAFGLRQESEAYERCFKPGACPQKFFANLIELAALRLRALGIEISASDSCTVCNSETLFSYRRAPVTGRMANVIFIRAD